MLIHTGGVCWINGNETFTMLVFVGVQRRFLDHCDLAFKKTYNYV